MILTLETKKVQIQGVKWTGDNLEEINAFVGTEPSPLIGDASLDPPEQWEWDERDSFDFLRVWNYLEKQWINCPLGHWVLKGLKNEFYPCEEEVLFAKYRIVNDQE